MLGLRDYGLGGLKAFGHGLQGLGLRGLGLTKNLF